MLQSEKSALRSRIRDGFPGNEERQRESAMLCSLLQRCMPLRTGMVVAAYMPMRREADILPLLAALSAMGCRLCLPRVEGR